MSPHLAQPSDHLIPTPHWENLGLHFLHHPSSCWVLAPLLNLAAVGAWSPAVGVKAPLPSLNWQPPWSCHSPGMPRALSPSLIWQPPGPCLLMEVLEF